MSNIVIKIDSKKLIIGFLLLIIVLLLVLVIVLLKGRKKDGVEQSEVPKIEEIKRPKSKPSPTAQKQKQSTSIEKNTLRGFYIHYDKMDWGDVPVTCDALVVTRGDPDLISLYVGLVREGNTINYVDHKDRLVFNLYLDGVDTQTRKTITSSTPGSPVEIKVEKHKQTYTDVPTCFSFVKILWARQIGD